MKYIIAYLGFILFFIACGEANSVVVKDENGVILEQYTIGKDSVKNGAYRAFSSKGVLTEEAWYADGKLDGKRILYYANCSPEIEENYKQDIMHGEYKVFYEEGQLQLLQTYEEGALTGVSTKYYPSGQIAEKVHFDNGQENGPFIEYYPNGAIHWEGAYLNGDNEFGLLKEYDDKGELIKKMMCDSMAVCRTIWTIEEGDIKPKY
jgi:antitoxin component YwqK of YwqJK toxin-antitoxin module